MWPAVPGGIRAGDLHSRISSISICPLKPASASAMKRSAGRCPAGHFWDGGRRLSQAPVAQLDRALPSEGRGHRFESCRVRQIPINRLCLRTPNAADCRTNSNCQPRSLKSQGREDAFLRLRIAAYSIPVSDPLASNQRNPIIPRGWDRRASATTAAVSMSKWTMRYPLRAI